MKRKLLITELLCFTNTEKKKRNINYNRDECSRGLGAGYSVKLFCKLNES